MSPCSLLADIAILGTLSVTLCVPSLSFFLKTTAFHMNTDLAIDAYFPGHKAEGRFLCHTFKCDSGNWLWGGFEGIASQNVQKYKNIDTST